MFLEKWVCYSAGSRNVGRQCNNAHNAPETTEADSFVGSELFLISLRKMVQYGSTVQPISTDDAHMVSLSGSVTQWEGQACASEVGR